MEKQVNVNKRFKLNIGKSVEKLKQSESSRGWISVWRLQLRLCSAVKVIAGFAGAAYLFEAKTDVRRPQIQSISGRDAEENSPSDG